MNSRNFPFHFGRTLIKFSQRRSLTKIKLTDIPNPFAELNVTICGASSRIGRLSAMLFKRENIFQNIVLWDEHYDMSELVTSDLCNIRTSTDFKSFCGRKGLVEAVSDSRIIYICSNIQTVPDVSPLDLFKSNANAVRQIILYVSEFNPTAMIVIGTPCVTSLVPMAYEEMLKNDCDAGKQIFGIAGNYVGIASSVAKELSPTDTFTQKHGVVGGCDKITCIPVFSKSVSGRVLSLPDFSHSAEEKELKGVKDVLKHFHGAEEKVLKTKVSESNVDGCYMALAIAGYQFITKLGRALAGEKNISDYAFVKQKNPKNFNERYLTCNVHLNEEGLESCHRPTLTAPEEANLNAVEKQLNSFIHAGEVYITGREQIAKHRKKVPKPKKEPKPEPAKEPEPKEDVFCKPRPKMKTIVLKNE